MPSKLFGLNFLNFNQADRLVVYLKFVKKNSQKLEINNWENKYRKSNIKKIR